jgi:hypothetical protein
MIRRSNPARASFRRAIRLGLSALLLAVLAGCASTGKVDKLLAQQMKAGNYPAALETVEAERDGSYRGKNRLIYFLERGLLLHYTGQYAESNAAFEEAKRIGNELYTKSLSGEGISLMSNDYALPYAGENFERTLIHLFASLNYLQLDDLDSALVEVRQVGDYLRKLQIDSSNENVYQEDAFARYLSALLYEAGGEYDAAFVDYKKALEEYEGYGAKFSVSQPSSLPANAFRIADRLGDWAQNDLLDRGIEATPRTIPEGSGELVILHYNGLSPAKGQDKFTIPFSDAWPLVLALQVATDADAQQQIGRATAFAGSISGVDVVSVAFPKYVDRPYSIAMMAPRVESASDVVGPELVEDIGAIAEKDLADRIVRIRTKAIARAAIKYAIQKGVQTTAEQTGGDYGALLSASTQLVGNIARFASEQADKRIWSTLPDQIWMASMIVPAGSHDVKIDFLNAQSAVVETRSIPSVEVQPGERRFVLVRTVN